MIADRTFAKRPQIVRKILNTVWHKGKRSTARPTMERMFKAFKGIDRIIFPLAEQRAPLLTAFKPVDERILALLGLQTALFIALQSA